MTEAISVTSRVHSYSAASATEAEARLTGAAFAGESLDRALDDMAHAPIIELQTARLDGFL
jgi:hypothetical protein